MVASTEFPEFFDDYTCPPWDTWIELIHDDKDPCLLAYVPDSLQTAVHQAIRCCTTYQLEWVPDHISRRMVEASSNAR